MPFYHYRIFWELLLELVKLSTYLFVAYILISGILRPLLFKKLGIPLDKEGYKAFMKGERGVDKAPSVAVPSTSPGGPAAVEVPKATATPVSTPPPAPKPEVIQAAVRELAQANPSAAASVIRGMMDAGKNGESFTRG